MNISTSSLLKGKVYQEPVDVLDDVILVMKVCDESLPYAGWTDIFEYLAGWTDKREYLAAVAAGSSRRRSVNFW